MTKREETMCKIYDGIREGKSAEAIAEESRVDIAFVKEKIESIERDWQIMRGLVRVNLA